MDTKKKILVVDDEPDLTKLIGHVFASKGFEVEIAGNGVEALEKTQGFRPDLIILDMNMPRMGGIEFYSKICGPDNKPMFPVLVLTARANTQDLFKNLEIDGFMIKPFELDRLVAEAELIIKKKAKGPAQDKTSLPGHFQKVCIVENDQETFDAVSGLFLNADFAVIPARSGAAGIEKMMQEAPDVAIVQLGLADIPGDTVIFRLSQMAKTMEVKFVLYTSQDAKHDQKVMERIASKTGIYTFVEYKALDELLERVREM